MPTSLFNLNFTLNHTLFNLKPNQLPLYIGFVETQPVMLCPERTLILIIFTF